MKNVIVTGATSFIGARLVQRLIEGPYKVFAVVKPNSCKAAALPRTDKIKIIEADMKDYKNLASLVGEPCDIYFSLAWNGTRGADRNNQAMQEENYRLSIGALRSALTLGCGIVISAGSQAEYGQYNRKISESTEEKPITEYGKYKLKYYYDAFQLCKEKNVDFKEPRFFSLYGEDDFEGTMIISMIKNMLENKDCLLTECVQMWDFLYITDAIEGMLALIETPCGNGVYNFGSGITRPLKEYVEDMHRLANSCSELLYGEILYPETGMVSIEPDITKLQTQTGWFPKVSFSEGVEKIINKHSGRIVSE
ncbi:MAG TPA: NAD(P)-dependent oxidoreductase [Anaerovoracaceae bacterium]|nr:NAD(P)-dependent oxidoreductase [Anaerovoracaceae bacterium]